jgi:L-alanine-DL-glutamate epimerase-like enolase superfamily enzyme
MQITDIRCYILEHTIKPSLYKWRRGLPPNHEGAPVGEKGHRAIIKVETDEGITGMVQSERGQLIADLVHRRLKRFIGMDPLMTEYLWHRIWEFDRIEEFPIYVLGMLDIACWDIKARAANMPLYKLLGGYEARVPVYASTITWDTMDDFERHIKECRDEGFTAFKLHAWGDVDEDAELSRNLRRWVGDDADLMFDGAAGWDYVQSLKFGHVLEELNYLWYEEPMREFDLPSYTELCRSLDIPVLAAETSDGCHWNTATWIQNRALDMVRIGAKNKGGITGSVKIAHLAESFGMRAQVHSGGYANLHLCAAIPNNDYFEIIVFNTDHIKGLKSQTELPITDGYITVPEEPGIQPHPDWDEIEAKAVTII